MKERVYAVTFEDEVFHFTHPTKRFDKAAFTEIFNTIRREVLEEFGSNSLFEVFERLITSRWGFEACDNDDVIIYDYYNDAPEDFV